MAEEPKNTAKVEKKDYQTSKKQEETVKALRQDPTRVEGANQK